jgi:peptidyl-prolyl cis-trans isomerase SurA
LRYPIVAALLGFSAYGGCLAAQAASNTCDTGFTVEQIARTVHSRDGVLAVVMDSPISNHELIQRVAWHIATLRTTPANVEINQIERQELRNLVAERSWVLKAQSLNVSVSKSEVDDRLAAILKRNGTSENGLRGALSRVGVDMATLRAQIAAQIARAKVTGARMNHDLRMPPRKCL